MYGIVLAGGKGKRLRMNISKPLVQLLGKPLIKHVVEVIEMLKCVDKLIIVANPTNYNELKEILPKIEMVIQEKALGTAHAANTAIHNLNDEDYALIMYSDTPLFRVGTLSGFIQTHMRENSDITFLSGLSEKPYPYALVIRDENGKIVDIIEHAKPNFPPPWEYSIGAYIFKIKIFKELYAQLKPNPEKNEYYIPDMIRIALKKGLKISSYICLDDREYLGINTQTDLKKAEEILLEREIEDKELFEEKYIKFGTGGWRAIIGKGFTSTNVKKLAQGIAHYLIENNLKERGIVIGYDNRFMSEDFAKIAAEVFAANNIKVWISQSSIPTPLVTFTVLEKNAGGGFVVTASHNPPYYNGIKFETSEGLPAPVDVTKRIEKIANELDVENIPWTPFNVGTKKGFIEEEDFRSKYLDYLEEKIDMKNIKNTGLKVCFDTMYGSGTSTVQMALIIARCDLTILHGRRDPLFGGKSPAPSQEALTYLIDEMKSGRYDVGIAVDGDADRIALVDEKGRFLHPNDVLPLVYYYLHELKGEKGPAVRNVATSHNLDRLARFLGEEVIEVPVGFKHIAKAMIKHKAVVGGESSGGITVRGHILEKDGVFISMLILEMMAKMKRKLSEILDEVKNKAGNWFYFHQENLYLTPDLRVKAERFLRSDIKNVGKNKIKRIIEIDGKKMIFEDDSWVLLRLSGTEPLMRIVAEAQSKTKALQYIKAIKKLILKLK